jgi:phosphoglycerate kinase
MNKMTVRDIDVAGKRVLVRVDFNVPIDAKTGAITDDSRIKAALPTIQYLIERQAKVILISHLGRPDGKVVDELRLAPVAQRLSQILGQQVGVAVNCIGPEVEKSVAALRPGHVMLLENLRFHSDEETGTSSFAQALARLGDVFVNDAFGTSHRAHASVAGIAKFLPAVAGLLLEKEVDTLSSLLKSSVHPFTSVFGGAKVSDKVKLLENLRGRVDLLLIGGGMSVTFLKAKSNNIGKSLIEKNSVEIAAELMEKLTKDGTRLLLPLDVIVTDKLQQDAKSTTVNVDKVPDDVIIADIGPKTVDMFRKELQRSKTVFWNGPMGVEEIPRFAGGTQAIAKTIAGLKATTIIGGGSTAEIVYDMGLADKFTFVSTGGGASLQFLGGEELPGVTALMDKK